MPGCQLDMIFVGDEFITRKGFLEGMFWGLAIANLSEEGSHGPECGIPVGMNACCSLEVSFCRATMGFAGVALKS